MVRIALIGLGNRGLRTLERYGDLADSLIDIVALSDLSAESLAQGQRLLRLAHRHDAQEYCGEHAWREACQRPDIDVVVVCTDWTSHVRMACFAMEQQKDVVIEVPACTSLEECRQLIETSRTTGRHSYMAENCCYDIFHLASLAIVRQGLLGDVTHLEGSYVHTLGEHGDVKRQWMLNLMQHHGGNPYPTHAVGPMLQIIEAASDGQDAPVSLVSATHPAGNDSLITTRQGRTMLLSLDVRTPRPYSRSQTICGTDGFIQKYPVPTLQLRSMGKTLTGDAVLPEMLRLAGDDPLIRLWREGQTKDVVNPMNYAMDIDMLRTYEEKHRFPRGASEAALWSGFGPLSEMSATQGGRPVEISLEAQ